MICLTTFTYGRGLAGRQIPGQPLPDHGKQGSDEKTFHGGNCGGERYANFIRNVGSTVFHDVPREELLRFNNHLLNYGDEAKLDDLAAAGLSPDYVFRETQRALAGVQGKCMVLPGIDIGIPTGKNSRKASPDDTFAAVAAALNAGADGLILSRKYSEMPLGSVQKLLPILAGAPPGRRRGAREGVYPQRYSTDRATKSPARRRPAPEGCGALARGLRCSSVRDPCGYPPSSRLAREPNPQQQNRN